MKKISIVALLVLGISALVGCKKDSDLIVGTWKGESITKYDKNGDVIGQPEPITNQFIKFEKDGSCSMGDETGSQKFTYSFDGKNLVLKSPDGSQTATYPVVELKEKSFKYKVDNHGDGYMIISFSKQ